MIEGTLHGTVFQREQPPQKSTEKVTGFSPDSRGLKIGHNTCHRIKTQKLMKISFGEVS